MKSNRIKKGKTIKFLALAITLVFALSAVPFIAFAQEPSSDESSISSEISQSEPDSALESESLPVSESESSTVPVSSKTEEPVPAEEPQGTVAPAEMVATQTATPEIRVHAYLVNEAGEPIDSNGNAVAPENKYVFETYTPFTEDQLVFESPIQYKAEDVLTIGGLTYQYMGAISGSDNPADPVILTEAEPVKNVYLAYSAKRTLTLYKKDAVTDLTWKTFVTKTDVFVGSKVSISSFYLDTQNPIGLPANMSLLGWSVNNTASTTDYPVFQPVAGTPDFIMADKNTSIYPVLESHTATGKIRVNRYLVNHEGVPISRDGSLLPTDDKTNWVLLESYFYSHNGSTDIPLNISITPFDNKSQLTFTENGKQVKYEFYGNAYDKNYIDFANDTFWLTTDGEIKETSYGYTQVYNDTFNTNFPADSKDYKGNPMVNRSWVQSYIANDEVMLNYLDANSSGFTAYDNLKATLPANYKFYGWSSTQYPPAKTAQDLYDIQSDPEFYHSTLLSFPQPNTDLVLYAVWGAKDITKVELKQENIIPYLVNDEGKAIKWDGSIIPFSPDNIEKLELKHDFYFMSNYEYIPGMIYYLYPAESLKATGYISGSPVERDFINVKEASKYGATEQPVKVIVDADGNLRDENGALLTLYYGYRVKYEVFINSNYPADSGKTSSISRTTHDRIWDFDPTYSFYTELQDKQYTFYGFIAKERDQNGVLQENFYSAYPKNARHYFNEPKYSDLELIAQWVPNSQVAQFNIYSYWVDYNGKPLDKDGYVIPENQWVTKGVLVNPAPIYTTPLPYVTGGSVYDFSFLGMNSLPDTVKDSAGETYKMSSSTYIYQEDLTTKFQFPITVDGNFPENFYKGFTSTNTISVNLNPPKELGITAITKQFSTSHTVNQPIADSNLKTAANFENFEGYTFVGWSYEADGMDSIIPYTILYSKNYILNTAKDITLYAQWKKDVINNDNFGNITIIGYAANENGRPINDKGVEVASPDLAKQIRYLPYQNEGDTSLKLGYDYRPAALNFTLGNTRYVYNPQTTSFGGNASMEPIHIDKQNKNVTLYFGYTYAVSYIINYNPNLPDGTTSEQQTQIGGPVYSNNRFAEGEEIREDLATYDNEIMPESFMYNFVGWTQSDAPSNSDTVYSTTGNSFTMPGHDVELFAKWIPLYTVEYYAGEHGTIVNPNSNGMMRYGKVVSGSVVPAAPSLTAEQGWEFAGWDNNYSSSMVVEGNLKFTARWKLIPVPSSNPVPASSSEIPASSSKAPVPSSSQAAVSSKAITSSSKAVISSSSHTSGSQSSSVSSQSSSSQSSSSSASSSSRPSSSQSSSSSSQSSSTSSVPSPSSSQASSSGSSQASSSIVPASNTDNSVSPGNEDTQREETKERLAESGVPTFQFGNSEVPLFGNGEKFVWSLASLMLAVISVIISAIMAVKLLRKREENSSKKEKTFSFVSVLLGLFSIIVFFILYNLNAVMVFIDVKTILFLVVFVAEMLLIILAKKSEKNEAQQN